VNLARGVAYGRRRTDRRVQVVPLQSGVTACTDNRPNSAVVLCHCFVGEVAWTCVQLKTFCNWSNFCHFSGSY